MDDYLYDMEGALLWAEARIPGNRFRSDAHTLTRKHHGVIRAVVVWDTFSTSGCFISIASDGSRKWLTNELAVRACAYPFIQCGHRRMSALVSVRNFDSLVFVRRFGFEKEGCMREAGLDGEDVILFGMLRSECGWLSSLPVKAMAV